MLPGSILWTPEILIFLAAVAVAAEATERERDIFESTNGIIPGNATYNGLFNYVFFYYGPLFTNQANILKI